MTYIGPVKKDVQINIFSCFSIKKNICFSMKTYIEILIKSTSVRHTSHDYHKICFCVEIRTRNVSV